MKKITIDSIDYNAVGLCCGLELHQQLDTNKLFCNCRSRLINEDTKPDKIIKRKLRPVYSESGEIDLAAEDERKKQKTYTYYFYNSCNCLVDSDSQPPTTINQDALKIALVVSKLTNSKLVDKSIVMRKQVVDGSNVSGFQRTTMISTDGFLNFDFGKVRIDKILLEEDSARAIERKENEVIYSLDRLGIPLIELVVWHDMHTPKQVKEVALNVGQLFRLTGFAKRGLGSIRQDINISIKEGQRVEIKGCQELDLIPEIVNREIIRQLSLLEVKKELKERDLSFFTLKEQNLSEVFKQTESKAIKSSLENKKEIYGFLIPKMEGILGYEIQPNRRVGSEISSYLKAKTSLKGLFHSDELPNYGILEKEIEMVYKKLSLQEKDAFILVMCDSREIELVKKVIENRLNKLLEGVLKETRMAKPDGNTEFARELSSGTRMYPETDVLPIEFTKELLDLVNLSMPLSIDKRKELYLNDFKISEQLAKKMYYDNYAMTFEKIVKKYNRNPTQVAVFLLEDLINLSRDNKIVLENVSSQKLLEFFAYKDFDKIPKSKILDVFVYFLENDCLVSDAITDLNIFEDASKIDLESIIDKIFLEYSKNIKEQKERSLGLLMGKTMAATKGLIDGKIISQKISSKLSDFLKDL